MSQGGWTLLPAAQHTHSAIQALLEQRLAAMARHGSHPDGGMQRVVYSPAWSAAVAELESWLCADGLAVRRDAVGNTYGVLPGSLPGPSIVTGSHIDTTLQGGRYDGTLGIVAGSVALKVLAETYGPPQRTLELLATCDEEASRFHSNFWGARAIAGLITPGEADAMLDRDGTTLANAMRGIGLDPALIPSAQRTDIGAFVELHIEQGPVLDRLHLPVAVVEAITGVRQREYTLTGRADHAGTTPMAQRLDPTLALAQIIPAVQRLALEMGPPAVATIGRIETTPGWPNIVPARVRFTIDARYHREVERQAYCTRIDTLVQAIADRAGLGLQVETLLEQPASAMTVAIVEHVCAAAEALAVPYQRLVSGAGHDSQVLARAGIPTGMVFVASRDGRSHSPDEYTSPEDCAIGTAVLIETLRRLAYE